MIDTVRGYGVNVQESAGNDAAAHAGQIRFAGYSVLPSAFSDTETAEFGARLDAVLRGPANEFGGDHLEQMGAALTARAPLVDDSGEWRTRRRRRSRK